MHRRVGDSSPWMALLVAVNIVCGVSGGPVGPLPNVTSLDLGLKEGSCSMGDVVYLPGDELPGQSPCERCVCTASGVQCGKQECQARPGCKAVHRPDSCCPIYQCECEQEGRMYSNGEKLVDPADPCRVCYCQGGEVVCRRIACFLRDDCRPRVVVGRCCPEYDNCPLRGVTTVPGASSTAYENLTVVDPPSPPAITKQEITIKEITPVSEIPVITEVKIKEIQPSPSIEEAEYSSSKSPLIPREATSEKTVSTENSYFTFDESVNNIKESQQPTLVTTAVTSESIKDEIKSTAEALPSKISFSTQDSINSELYPSNTPELSTKSPKILTPATVIATLFTTKAPVIEEDESILDHNPAFPPIPDDLSVMSNHEDEIMPEQTENEHFSSTTEEDTFKKHISTLHDQAKESTKSSLKEIILETTTILPSLSISAKSATHEPITTVMDLSTTSNPLEKKHSPMLNLRSAIPTEILNIASSIPEDLISEDNEKLSTILPNETTKSETENSENLKEVIRESVNIKHENVSPSTEMYTLPSTLNTQKEEKSFEISTITPLAVTTYSPDKTNMATDKTFEPEISSFPIETSDQKPRETTVAAEMTTTYSSPQIITETQLPIQNKQVTIAKETLDIHKMNESEEEVETTEFVVSPFESSESSTDMVEVIKISTNKGDKAAIIETVDSKKNMLRELINLVGDVASINDRANSSDKKSSFSDSEELIPVNAGYKSKTNNWSINSITEIPLKASNKQKIVEIEDEDNDNITDSPPPYDKKEPTTKRPIIDNVSDTDVRNKTDQKDIEILTQSYVPTINRRPTKVVMKKSDEPSFSQEVTDDASEFNLSKELFTSTDSTNPSEIQENTESTAALSSFH